MVKCGSRMKIEIGFLKKKFSFNKGFLVVFHR